MQQQLQLFQTRLPERPYHTDALSSGLRIADAQRALKSRYIQHNGPTHKFWMVFDVDRAGSAIDWSDRGCPAPNITAMTRDNAHAHLIYGLEIAVRTAPDGKLDPLRYAAAVEIALADKLQADLGYAGLICKNPCHPHWQVKVWEDNLYDLGELSDYLDLSRYADKRKNMPEYGLGRNCTLFDRLRKWAYKAIRQGWPAYDRWLMAVEDRAQGYNDFEAPLPLNEVRHTAKSVAKWTYKHFSQAGFSAVQAERGRRGGIKSGKVRHVGSITEQEPWKALGVSRASWYRQGKPLSHEIGVRHEALSDNSSLLLPF